MARRDHACAGSPPVEAPASSGAYLVAHPPLARALPREHSAIALLDDVSSLLQHDEPDERALLGGLAHLLAEAGLESVIDVDDRGVRARYGDSDRNTHLESVIERHAHRAIVEQRPVWVCREPMSRPCGPSARVCDGSALRELAAADLDWILSVGIDGRAGPLGTLTAYGRIDESTFPSVALVCAIARLTGDALSRRRDREAMIDAIERRELAMAIVAHDLKNPLSVIRTTVRLLRSGQTTLDDPITGAAAIDRQVTRMLLLVHDILEAAVVTSNGFILDRTRCAPQALVASALAVVGPLATPKNLHLVAPPVDAPDVLADARRIEQVLVNMIGNALKFTPIGGTIEVGCRLQEDEVAFSVADSGPGIAADHVPHVFDRFWSGGSPSAGAGLGLAIARDIVAAHGGKIWVESEPGRGAKFVFTVPLAH